MNLLSQTLVYFFFVLLVSSDKASSHLPLDEIVKIPDPEDNIIMSLIKNRNGRRMCTYKEHMHPLGSTEDLHISIRMYRDDGHKDSGRMNVFDFKRSGNDLLIQTHPLRSFQQGADRDSTNVGNTAIHNPVKNLCIYTTNYVSLDYIEPFVKDMIATRTHTNNFGDENKQNYNLNEHQKKVFRYYKSKLALPPDFDYYIYAWVTDKPCSEFRLGEPRYEFVLGQSSPVISRTELKQKK